MLNRTGVQNSYSHKVRIGNWSEDQALSELRMKEYLQRKASGGLLGNSVRRNHTDSLTEAPLTFADDGFIHIGDHLMLYSAKTEGVLSIDLSDRINSSDEGYNVTTSTLTQAHVARNVFVIEPFGQGVMHGDVLRLGQPFRIRVHPTLLGGESFCLFSQPVSSMSASKVTRKQEVGAILDTSYDTVWIAQHKLANRRFEMEGQPVPANAEIIIVHAGTKQALSSDLHAFNNDFGREFEVCAYSHLSVNKRQGLYAELQGKTTPDIPMRKEGAPNWWAFLTATTPEGAVPRAGQEDLPPADDNAEVAF
jgi:hypothetical protein